jgi:hypothetical protein
VLSLLFVSYFVNYRNMTEDSETTVASPPPEEDSEMPRPAYSFSPDAAPFTPKSGSVSSTEAQETKTSEEDTVDNAAAAIASKSQTTYALSVDAPEFFPRNYKANGMSRSPAFDAVGEVRQAIARLTATPADLHQVMVPLVELFVLKVTDEQTLAAIVEELFVQSIREPNFRYTSARMCSCLSERLQLSSGASFQAYLVNRCLAEFDYYQQMAGTNLATLIGFTLFLSELLLNMRDTETGHVIVHFPQQIAQLVSVLLGYRAQSEIALHCVIQVLKLTGAVLEENISCMDDIFIQIRARVVDPDTPQQLRAMLVSVIELRASNWGRNETERTVGAGDSMVGRNNLPRSQLSADQVYYSTSNMSFVVDDADGASGLSEGGWLTDSATGSVTNVHELIPTEYWVGNDTMDPETAAAYEQFITENHHQARPAFSGQAAVVAGNSQSTQLQPAAASYCYNGGWNSYQP